MQAVNKRGKKLRYICPVMVLILLFFTYTLVSFAEEIDFEKVVETGLKNNYDLQEKNDYIKTLKRERGILEAGVDWHFGINGNYLYSSERLDSDFSIIDSGDASTFVLEGAKNTANGFSINSQLSIMEEEAFQFEDLDNKYNFKLD